MDIARLLELGMKGVSIIQTLAQQRQDIMPVVTALKNVFSKQEDQITEADLDAVEEVLDRMLDEFEKPLLRKS